jgi:phage antirepressor YoqD-like protein
MYDHSSNHKMEFVCLATSPQLHLEANERMVQEAIADPKLHLLDQIGNLNLLGVINDLIRNLHPANE